MSFGIHGGHKSAAAAGGISSAEQNLLEWDGTPDGPPAVMVADADTSSSGFGLGVVRSDDEEYICIYQGNNQIRAFAMDVDFGADTIDGGSSIQMVNFDQAIYGTAELTSARSALVVEGSAHILTVSGTNTLVKTASTNMFPSGGFAAQRSFCKIADDEFLGLGISATELRSKVVTVTGGLAFSNGASTDTTYDLSTNNSQNETRCVGINGTRAVAFVLATSGTAGVGDITAILLKKVANAWTTDGGPDITGVIVGGSFLNASGDIPHFAAIEDGGSGSSRINSNCTMKRELANGDTIVGVVAHGPGGRQMVIAIKYDLAGDTIEQWIPLETESVNPDHNQGVISRTDGSSTQPAGVWGLTDNLLMANIENNPAYKAMLMTYDANGNFIQGKGVAVIAKETSGSTSQDLLRGAMEADLTKGIIVGYQLSNSSTGEVFAETLRL